MQDLRNYADPVLLKLDIGAMAKKGDEYLARLYLTCYFLPTLKAHSTLHAFAAQTKTSDNGGLTFDDAAQREHSDEAFRAAHLTMLLALGTQNRHFKLGLDEELGERRGEFAEAWGQPPEDVTAGTSLK